MKTTITGYAAEMERMKDKEAWLYAPEVERMRDKEAWLHAAEMERMRDKEAWLHAAEVERMKDKEAWLHAAEAERMRDEKIGLYCRSRADKRQRSLVMLQTRKLGYNAAEVERVRHCMRTKKLRSAAEQHSQS